MFHPDAFQQVHAGQTGQLQIGQHNVVRRILQHPQRLDAVGSDRRGETELFQVQLGDAPEALIVLYDQYPASSCDLRFRCRGSHTEDPTSLPSLFR